MITVIIILEKRRSKKRSKLLAFLHFMLSQKKKKIAAHTDTNRRLSPSQPVNDEKIEWSRIKWFISISLSLCKIS